MVEQKEGQTERTAIEKKEEEIVTEYVKKQSLLEAQSSMNSQGGGNIIEDENEVDLQRALRSSLQEQNGSAGNI